MRDFTSAASPLSVSSLLSSAVMPRVPAFALRGLRRAGARFLAVAMRRHRKRNNYGRCPELFFGGGGGLRRAGGPCLPRRFVAAEHRGLLFRPRAPRRGE